MTETILERRTPRELATVVSVEVVTAGSFTATPGDVNPEGALMLLVADVGDFYEDGGTAVVGGYVEGGVVAGGLPMAYTGVGIDEDTGDEWIELVTALPYDVPDRTPVYDTPARQRKEVVAVLAADGSDLTADVPPGALWSDTRLTETTTGGQTIEVSWDHADQWWHVVGIPGSPPQINTAHLDPATTPPPEVLTNAFLADPDAFAGTIPPSGIAAGKLPPGVATGSWQHDDQGSSVIGADGAAVIDVPNDGRPPTTRGNFDGQRAAWSEGSQQGGENLIPPGGAVRYSSTPGAPPVAPTVTQGWTTIPTALTVFSQRRLRGFAMRSATQAATINTGRDFPRLLLFHPDTGVQTGRLDLTGAPTPAELCAVSWSGDATAWVTLEYCEDPARWLVRYYSTSGAFLTEWVVVELGNLRNPFPGMDVSTSGGVETVTIGRLDGAGTATLWRYADHVLAATVTTDDLHRPEENLAGLALVGDEVILATYPAHATFPEGVPGGGGAFADRPVMPFVAAATGDLLGWLPVGNRDVQGTPAHLDGDTALRTFYLSTVTPQVVVHGATADAGRYDVAVRWRVSIGGAYSAISPVATVEKAPGSVLTVSVSPPPPGSSVDGIDVFVGTEGGTLYLQGSTSFDVYTKTVQTIATSGTTPGPATLVGGGVPATALADDGSVIFDASYSNPLTVPERLEDVETALAGIPGALGAEDEVFLGFDSLEVYGRV